MVLLETEQLVESAGVVTRSAPLNFVNPSTEVNVGIWLLFVGATAFLGLRLWCKLDRRTGLWWDDHILVAAWMILLGTNILISAEYATGYVKKDWDDRMLILVSTSSCLITIGQTLSKTAFAVTLLRITESWQRWVLWLIISTLNIYMVVLLFINWTNYCGKTAYWWRIPSVCAPYGTVLGLKIGQNIYNIVLDFVLSLFPWVITWNLNIGRTDKVGLCVSMSLGVAIAIFSSVRTWYMLGGEVHLYDSWYFWRQGMTEIWYQAEVAGTIIVQTLPVIRLLLQDLNVSIMPMRLNETPGVLTVGTATNKTARNSRAWAAANNPHSLSDVDGSDLESGGGGLAGSDREDHHFEMHELGKTSTEGLREQTGYTVQVGYAI